jgi:Domain of unknown function (DUF4259)
LPAFRNVYKRPSSSQKAEGLNATLAKVGAWGTGIFSNDTAADIRGDLRELLEDGLTPDQATQKLVSDASTSVDDPDDATSFWTGLAAAQMSLGVLLPLVRDRAVALIDSGGDLHMWTDAKLAAKRRAVLEGLRRQLLGPQKAPVKVRKPKRIPCPVKPGEVFLLTLEDGRQARFQVLRIDEHRMGDFPIIELIDDRGRPFRRHFKQPDDLTKGLLKRDPLARFEIISGRFKDLPAGTEISVVGTTKPQPQATAPTYTSWRNLKREAKRLIDEPGAQPKSGLFG